jgi:TPR repeat protein
MENQENLSTDELYNLGEKYYKEKNYEEAVKYWEKAAMMGNSSARSSLKFLL